MTRFCAKESVERRDNYLGTMTTVKCYLLIEYDNSWSKEINNLLENSKIETEVVNHINDFTEWCPEDVKVLFIKNKETGSGKKIYLTRVHKGKEKVSEFFVDNYKDILTIDLKNAYKNPGGCKNILVVCTHGKHDKCCAKFGHPVFLGLSKWIKNTGANFEVWECSHVGGDRFAANIIWLPYGLGFGHVELDTEIFLNKLIQNKIPLEYFRGCSFFSSAGQFLEGVIRKKYNLDNPGGVEVIRNIENHDNEGNIYVDIEMSFKEIGTQSISGLISIRLDKENGKVLASCNDGGYAYPRIIELVNIPNNPN
ncbi:hypothetical protein HWV00_01885 [Moritella sp. 24]|uniref:sucrase ferredoxin n=1 Tax=Moritella sp. 24 TaxID=2746230 RepID=UPI001BAE1862|nr:sucrase ferredoxin [Moritella sp. 24]QUM75090.1 hypothetical protein HWV00_01885 [Moritella sp. 24]